MLVRCDRAVQHVTGDPVDKHLSHAIIARGHLPNSARSESRDRSGLVIGRGAGLQCCTMVAGWCLLLDRFRLSQAWRLAALMMVALVPMEVCLSSCRLFKIERAQYLDLYGFMNIAKRKSSYWCEGPLSLVFDGS